MAKSDTQENQRNRPPEETTFEKAPREAGAEQVQQAIDEETEQGFRGTKVDPTPNSAYTVAGVTAG